MTTNYWTLTSGTIDLNDQVLENCIEEGDTGEGVNRIIQRRSRRKFCCLDTEFVTVARLSDDPGAAVIYDSQTCKHELGEFDPCTPFNQEPYIIDTRWFALVNTEDELLQVQISTNNPDVQAVTRLSEIAAALVLYIIPDEIESPFTNSLEYICAEDEGRVRCGDRNEGFLMFSICNPEPECPDNGNS